MSVNLEKEACKKQEKNYSDEYDSQEDLERLIRISITDKKTSQANSNLEVNYNSNSAASVSLENEKNVQNGALKLEKNIDDKSIGVLRFLNCLSIMILLVTFFTTSISRINNEHYNLLMEYLKRDKIQAESNLFVLYIAFFFVTLSLIFALFRNLVVMREKDFAYLDIQTVISVHFSHFYYTGNLLFSLCLISNHMTIIQRYGVNLLICVMTLLIYSKAYVCHKRKFLNVKLDNIFNYVAFSVNISFLLAWNVCYLTISIASFLSFYSITTSAFYLINLSLQLLLCIFVVLSLSYFYDLYFSFIVLIFQIGNTLNNNLFSFNTDDSAVLKSDSNVSLVLTGFTLICFFWSLIYIPRMKTTQYNEDLDELNQNYFYDKEKPNHL